MGMIFLLERETGEPLYPIEERPVPQAGVPEETLSPTQPVYNCSSYRLLLKESTRLLFQI